MADKEIRQKIVLDGEKQYSQAIREAQRNLRTLRSELRAETAELGNNATAQQKAEAKTKSLKQQIAEQERIVATLREALAEVKEKYGDNADEVARWETRLNNARTSLANMRNELDGVGSGMQGVQRNAELSVVATRSLSEALEKVGDAGGAISDKIESLFSTMVSTVHESITALWAELMDIAGKANEWGDVAGMWNTDSGTIEKWYRSVHAATGDWNAMLTAVTKINDLNDKQQQKVAEWTGVSGENYADRWEYAVAVLEAMEKMDYGTRLAASEDIFGAKRASGIVDLLNDWNAIRERLGMFDADNGGLGLGTETLEQMTELDRKVATIKETWNAFIDSFVAKHFGNLALNLTGDAQVILEDLIKYLDTGSDEDLAKLEEDITTFFDRVVAAIQSAAEKLGEAGKKLEESDNGVVRAIGKAMKGLSGALQWIAEPGNIEKVVAAFEVLAAFWLAGKGLQLVNTIASLAANFQIIAGSSALSGAAGAGGSAAAAAAGGGGIGSLLTGAGYLAVAVMMLAPTLMKLLGGEGEDPNLPPEQKEATELVKKIAEQGGTVAPTGGASTQRDMLGSLFSRATYTGGDTSGMAINKTEAERSPYEPDTDGVIVIPRAGAGKVKATAEQRAAAETYWDFWKAYREHPENPEEFDAAWAQFEGAFGGNEKAFERLNSLMDRLIDSLTEGGADWSDKQWQDLPAEWWKRIPEGENGVTSQDVSGLLQLPVGIQSAAMSGIAAGIRGIRVTLDGRAVGELVAPYVSENIARDIG